MSKKPYLTPLHEVAFVREHLLEHVPISDRCDKHPIHATQDYAWQKQLFEGGSVAFLRNSNIANERRRKDAQRRRVEELESKIQTKTEVVGEPLDFLRQSLAAEPRHRVGNQTVAYRLRERLLVAGRTRPQVARPDVRLGIRVVDYGAGLLLVHRPRRRQQPAASAPAE